MRGDVIFQIFGIHQGREKNSFFGAFRTIEEARAKIEALSSKVMHDQKWAHLYHNDGFEIRQTVVETDFEIPSRPKPRHNFVLQVTDLSSIPTGPTSTRVEVYRRGVDGAANVKLCEYDRNYDILQTFEPFRQNNREFALISRDYTSTAVLDLSSGLVIAEEEPSSGGFCPVGFYVPDWWDVHGGSNIPGSDSWSPDYEWPTGNCGFVWGCVWGDDSSLKIQYLDLSEIQRGVIRRDERFGYLELAADNYTNPCLVEDAAAAKLIGPPDFIHLARYRGAKTVRFAVNMQFDIQSGKSSEWQRLKIANFE